MFIVMGGTGHVGGAVARALIAQGQPVTIVTRDAGAASAPEGATVAEADVADIERLRAILRTGRRAFLLNPPAAPSTDTDAEERRTIDAIVAALDGSGLEKLVAQSTYGAQAGEAIGDLGTLHGFEQALAAQPIPVTIQRGAYYMSNWDVQLDAARDGGRITSMFPADLALPMIAPADLGTAAARWLLEPADRTALHHVEGPDRYSAIDVAEAFAAALGRPVEVDVVPRDAWIATFERLGFSPSAARSYAGMTATATDTPDLPDAPVRGPTDLPTYIAQLARR
jgi:uncharacterized protein YbjT (DUF2867 family)